MLAGRLFTFSLHPFTHYEYGTAFEHFIFLDFFRLNSYYEKNFQVFYLRDKDNNEIDMIIQKPKGEEVLVEIKSSDQSRREHGRTLEKFMKLWDRPCMAQVWSNDPKNRKIGSVRHYHWKTALKRIFHDTK